MRAMIGTTVVILMTGCSVLDGLTLGSPSYDPSLIYLDGELPITLGPSVDRDRYACMRGPLLCKRFGASWECACP